MEEQHDRNSVETHRRESNACPLENDESPKSEPSFVTYITPWGVVDITPRHLTNAG